MKKVSELEGSELDYWVARAQGWEKWHLYPDCWLTLDRKSPTYQYFHPSKSWHDGGPIIEREKIMLEPGGENGSWCAHIWYRDSITWHREEGATPLIAAMRAYVASKYGEEIMEIEE